MKKRLYKLTCTKVITCYVDADSYEEAKEINLQAKWINERTMDNTIMHDRESYIANSSVKRVARLDDDDIKGVIPVEVPWDSPL